MTSETSACGCRPGLITIAIDGFSSSGKSSMARQLAKNIGYRYIDSGAMYRAVTLYALRHGLADTGSHKVDTAALTAALSRIPVMQYQGQFHG